MFIYISGNTQTYDSNIPLKNINVNANLIDIFGEVTISQTYKNNYNKEIEAIYCFNLDKSSVISSMSLILDGKKLISQIKEKTTARTDYTTAKSEHKTTCLLEKNLDGSYKVNLGNIKVNQEITVELTYLTTLEYSYGFAKFVLPTNIAEKYNGSNNRTIRDINHTQLTHSSNANYTFNFNLNFKSQSDINCVKSQTNEIQVTSVSNKEVNVTSTSKPSSGDFVLLFDTVIAPGVYYNTQNDKTYLAITHKVPDQFVNLGIAQKEFIFVVDRSGSMGDNMASWSGNNNRTKMELTKEALKLFINSLPPRSKFNIYSFGSSFESMFRTSVDLTNDIVKDTLKKIDGFSANMGGTNIYECLQSILSGETVNVPDTKLDLAKRIWKPDPASDYEKITNDVQEKQLSSEKILFLLTDGQVSNSNTVVQLCEQYSYITRIFCIGVGSDVDRNLVTNISEVSNGYSEVLVDNDDISSTVIKMLDSSLKTYYKFVSVTINGEKSNDYVMYPNLPLTVFKVIPTDVLSQLNQISITAINGTTDETEKWTIPLENKVKSSNFLCQFWANDQIKYYLKENSKNRNTANIIRLSIENSLATEFTSFILVDQNVNTSQFSEPLTVNVPQHRRLSRAPPTYQQASFCSYGRSPDSFCMKESSINKKKCKSKQTNNLTTPNVYNTSFSADLFATNNKIFRDTSECNAFDEDECDESDEVSSFINSEFSPQYANKNNQYINNTTKSNMDYLLEFKNVDGSFQHDTRILNIIGVSVDKFNNVVQTQCVSEQYLTNLLILAYIKSLNNTKYIMIQNVLELWLSSNSGNSVGNISTSVIDKLLELSV